LLEVTEAIKISDVCDIKNCSKVSDVNKANAVLITVFRYFASPE
jgi:hypothetical protein